MKFIFGLITILLINFSISAQIDKTDFQKKINKKAEILREVLEAKDYISDFEKVNEVGFTIDTFKIEQMLTMRLDVDFTTFSMIEAITDAENAYDKLLNKYYQILKKKLSEEDQEALKKTQLNWIKFRDSEKTLNVIISMPQYSGGGTMHDITVAFENFEITKQRVLEIYSYISRFFEYEY